MAKLYFRYGAMNSGKTTFLIQSAYNYEERGMKVLVIKPEIDTKGCDTIVTRVGLKRKVDYMFSKNVDLYSLLKDKLKDIACVFVDEAQFITCTQADELLKITALCDVPVICYGLRTDFKMNGFEGATRLLQIAHSIEEMKTICRCGKKAIFNMRRVNGKCVFEGESVVIDNDAKVEYESVCAKCYFKNIMRKIV